MYWFCRDVLLFLKGSSAEAAGILFDLQSYQRKAVCVRSDCSSRGYTINTFSPYSMCESWFATLSCPSLVTKHWWEIDFCLPALFSTLKTSAVIAPCDCQMDGTAAGEDKPACLVWSYVILILVKNPQFGWQEILSCSYWPATAWWDSWSYVLSLFTLRIGPSQTLETSHLSLADTHTVVFQSGLSGHMWNVTVKA